MKSHIIKRIAGCFLFLLISQWAQSQILQIECGPHSACPVQHTATGYRPPQAIGNVNMVLIYAVPLNPPDSSYYWYPDTTLPDWYTNVTQIEQFLRDASHQQHNVSVSILVDTTKVTYRPFRAAVDLTPDTTGDRTVYRNISTAFTTSVLDSVDKHFDLGQFDNDGPDGIPNSGDDDGYVDFVLFHVIWPNGRGGVGLQIDEWEFREGLNSQF